MSAKTSGFIHISSFLPDLLKEVERRVQLRTRLEAERGRELTDEEFIRIAESTGVRL